MEKGARTTSGMGLSDNSMSRYTPKRDAREMTATREELDLEFQLHAGLALDEDLGFGAGRSAWPGDSWLETRRSAGRAAAEVDFVRCGAFQSGVRALRVVPVKKQLQLALEAAVQQRHHGEHASAAVFQAPDEAFHHGDAAGLADGSAPMADAVPKAPRLEASAGELRAAVGHEKFRRGTDTSNDAAEQLANALGCRLTFENGAPGRGESNDRQRRSTTSRTASTAAARTAATRSRNRPRGARRAGSAAVGGQNSRTR